MSNVTGILLNWKRTANVLHILAGWQSGGIVREAIVWNNNRRVTLTHDWAKVVTSAEDLGLYTRFAAACLARTDCIAMMAGSWNVRAIGYSLNSFVRPTVTRMHRRVDGDGRIFPVVCPMRTIPQGH